MIGSLNSFALNRVSLNGALRLGVSGPAWTQIKTAPADAYSVALNRDHYLCTPPPDFYCLQG